MLCPFDSTVILPRAREVSSIWEYYFNTSPSQGGILFVTLGMKHEELRSTIESALLSLACADALGTVYEFKSRAELQTVECVTMMVGGGTHGQPAGVYSDDTCLTLCLADSLCFGYDIRDIGRQFCLWFTEGHWAADYATVFDIGGVTREAILKMLQGVSPLDSGLSHEHSKGNGSLMRVLPLVFYTYIKDIPIHERYELTREVSAITHATQTCTTACFYYLEYAKLLLDGKDKFEAYWQSNKIVRDHLLYLRVPEDEMQHFNRILDGRIYELAMSEIYSGGYVVETLEAALYCLLNCDTLEAVAENCIRLGSDTDTVSAVASGLQGLLLTSKEEIPADWLAHLARRQDIEALAARLAASLCQG
ncbi:ADP-ribosylation/crystallin J1 [Pontibacter sp. BAB1700]|nr:ADP-ribosylation/crystallin J1 [Pontibacter sp. BAB1700]